MQNIKNSKETIKTIALTLLIGLIIGFISGVKAQSTVTKQLTDAAAATIQHQVAPTAQAASK